MPGKGSRAIRRRVAGAGVVALVMAGWLGAASPAHAITVVSCPAGSVSVTYSPGLTNTVKPTAIATAEALGQCAVIGQPRVSSGTSNAGSVVVPASCLGLLDSGSSQSTITCNTGQTSVFTFNLSVSVVQGQAVTTRRGRIASGLYAGATATGVRTLVSDLMACSTPAGLASSTGTYTFSLVHL